MKEIFYSKTEKYINIFLLSLVLFINLDWLSVDLQPTVIKMFLLYIF